MGRRSSRVSVRTLLWEQVHRYIEPEGIHDISFLELDPDPVRLLPWEHHLELHLCSPVCPGRMLVHHVDEVLTDGEQVTPDTEVLLQTVGVVDRESQLGAVPDHGLPWDGFQGDC